MIKLTIINDKRQRLEALFGGQIPDRPPVAFWHHFYPDGDPRRLAVQTADFYHAYDPDFAKLMPDLPLGLPNDSIRRSTDWNYVTPIPVDRGPGLAWLTAAQLTRQKIGRAAPFLVTMFSPLTWAQYWVGLDRLGDIALENPARIHRALSITAESIRQLISALITAGVDGIYFSVWGTDVLDESTYREFGRPYDLYALDGASAAPFNVLHVHGGVGTRLDLFRDYPCSVVSWSTLDTGITMPQGRTLLNNKVVMGGIEERGEYLTEGHFGESLIDRQISDSVTAMGSCLIVAPGCSLPDEVSPEILRRMREDVERRGV